MPAKRHKKLDNYGSKTFRMPEEMLAALAELARAEQERTCEKVSDAAIVRRFVREGLERAKGA